MSPPDPPKPRPRWLLLRIRKGTLLLTEEELLQALPADLLVAALRRGRRWLRQRRYRLPGPLPTLDRLLPPPPRRKRGGGTTAPPGPNSQGSPAG